MMSVVFRTASVVLIAVWLAQATAVAADTPDTAAEKLSTAEEEFLRTASESFEKGDFDDADLSLERFRLLAGPRQLPAPVTMAVLDLGFRISLAKARHQVAVNKDTAAWRLADSKAWSLVEQRTVELVMYLDQEIFRSLERKNPSTAVVVAGRQQRVRLDRASMLRMGHAFKEALAEIDLAMQLYEKYEKESQQIINVQTRMPSGIETLQRTRGDAAGFSGRSPLKQERIAVLTEWSQKNSSSQDVTKELADSYWDFVNTYPSDERSFKYALQAMQLANQIDVDKLAKIQIASGNKESTQYISNQIAVANYYLGEKRRDEALGLYSQAVKSGLCPPRRLPEAYVQMADIYAANGNKERALEYYRLASSLTDQFAHIPSAVRRLERESDSMSSNPVESRDTTRLVKVMFWGNLAFVTSVAIYFTWKWIRRAKQP